MSLVALNLGRGWEGVGVERGGGRGRGREGGGTVKAGFEPGFVAVQTDAVPRVQ